MALNQSRQEATRLVKQMSANVELNIQNICKQWSSETSRPGRSLKEFLLNRENSPDDVKYLKYLLHNGAMKKVFHYITRSSNG